MSHFSERLKYIRELKKEDHENWTQQYVAQRIGVARSTYTAYERGTKQPPLDTINILADLLEVSTDYLLGRTNDPNHKDREHSSLHTFYDDRNISADEKVYLEEELEKYRRLKQKWKPERKDEK